jgi:tetratricopeptide (TPR) repeat protein
MMFSVLGGSDMALNVFLSLSYVDASFVRTVRERLPSGLARLYERSFERGADLIAAMETSLDASEVFVLFASKAALDSYAVKFEINEARVRFLFGNIKRVLVFPVEAGLRFGQLPAWLQRSWVPNAGESAADIARYITTTLLEPDRGLSIAAPKVVGRGSALDRAERLTANHLQKHRRSPSVYIFSGLTGVGRRTFAAYYLRRALSADANLPFGPVLPLSAQAELIDIYQALRIEIDPKIKPAILAEDQGLFVDLDQNGRIAEIVRAMGHFTRLGQAITIISAAGLFEDAGRPKDWVTPLIEALPDNQLLVLVTNLQFRAEYVDNLSVAVQMRIEELSDDDIRALMIFTAQALGVADFSISGELVVAIGGHADVANAAVKLALQKGTAILERDPSQLYNIQKAILGEALEKTNLTATERLVLDVLGWLPNLGADLLEKIIVTELKVSPEDYDSAIENLIIGCLIYANGYKYSIAPAVRQLYRRFNVADADTISAMAKVFSREWAHSKEGGFRDDLFAAFVFMQILERKSLPPELKKLLTPGRLHDAVRDAYARGKEADDPEAISQAIAWGKAAFEMNMSDGVREEILSTVARAQIWLTAFDDAAATIAMMRDRDYRSVTFLEGYSLRKQRKFEEAVPKLRFVVDHFRHNRAAVHELALCYRRLRRLRELEELLKAHGHTMSDSSMFLDFTIALSIARGDLASVPSAIARLRAMDDSPSRADLRHAQLLMKRGDNIGANRYLSQSLGSGGRGNSRLRTLRVITGAKIGDFETARDDLNLLRSLPNGAAQAANLETQILFAEGRLAEALELNQRAVPQEPGDWLVRASILEALAAAPEATIKSSASMRREAAEIRAMHAREPDYIFED